MEELPLPYEECLLRKLTDLLIERSLPGHLNSINSEIEASEEEKGQPHQPWAGFIQDAAIRYQQSSLFCDQLDDSATDEVRAELKAFRKLLDKIAAARIQMVDGYSKLSDNALGMLNLGAVTTEVSLDELIKTMRKPDEQQAQLTETAKNALKHLNKSPGPTEDLAYLEFAADLANTYVDATGRQIGKGHKFNDPAYETPFEKFLLACIKPLRPSTTVESVRKQIDKIKGRTK